MIGIVWTERIDSIDGKTQFLQIRQGYIDEGIYPVKEVKQKNTCYIRFVNNDIWYLIRASENARGHRCNVAYIHRNISSGIINNVILPSLLPKPYRGVTYYGEAY